MQIQAIDMLATGAKQIVVVERVGCSSATLKRWLNQAEFITALDLRINEGREDAMRHLRTLNQKAVETLQRLLEDEGTPANVRMTTAFKILGIAVPAYVADDHDRSDIVSEQTLKRIREQVYGIFDTTTPQEAKANDH